MAKSNNELNKSSNDQSKKEIDKEINKDTEKIISKIDYNYLENSGLNYIKNQKRYLFASVFLPIFIIATQIINFIFLLLGGISPHGPIGGNMHPPQPGSFNPPIPLFDTLTPVIILMIFAIIGVINGIFLANWLKKIQNYDLHKTDKRYFTSQEDIDKTNPVNSVNENTSNNISGEKHENRIFLTKLFYEIVGHIEKVRAIFIIMNIVFILYFQFFLRYFLLFFMEFVGLPFMDIHTFLNILNFITQIVLIIYLVIEWKHFIHWNSKLNKLKRLEHEISKEISVDDD